MPKQVCAARWIPDKIRERYVAFTVSAYRFIGCYRRSKQKFSDVLKHALHVICCKICDWHFTKCNSLMGLLQLRYEHDSSTIRLRFDYDSATTRYEVFRALAYEIVYENQW